VEINNTDAEGRIVLGDGVYHASHELSYTPSIIIDMATLTGVQMMATGLLHASIYCNTESAESRVFKAGLACGDMCYPVLYCPELHAPEYPSAMTDMRNSLVGRVPNASVSTAGRFVEVHLNREYKGEWVHVDLAGPATRDEATGFGVALIAQLYAGELL
jgi:probable aminopeptidase NPEPL1